MLSQEIVEVRQYSPNAHVQVLIEDLTSAMCHAANCYPSRDDMCGHKHLATEMTRATLDHYIDVFVKAGHIASADLLRDEM